MNNCSNDGIKSIDSMENINDASAIAALALLFSAGFSLAEVLLQFSARGLYR
jgi:hypothetical protein